MCREGQEKIPRAFILADPEFYGDSEAFCIKNKHVKEEELLRAPFNTIKDKDVAAAFEHISALKADAEMFKAWEKHELEKQRMEYRAQRERIRREKAEAIDAQTGVCEWRSNPVELS